MQSSSPFNDPEGPWSQSAAFERHEDAVIEAVVEQPREAAAVWNRIAGLLETDGTGPLWNLRRAVMNKRRAVAEASS